MYSTDLEAYDQLVQLTPQFPGIFPTWMANKFCDYEQIFLTSHNLFHLLSLLLPIHCQSVEFK